MKFWNDLSPRERLILGCGIPLMALATSYVLYGQPMTENLERLRNEVPRKAAELAWAKHEINNASEWLTVSSASQPQKPILTVIETAAIQTNVKDAIQRVQPENSQVKLWFQDVVSDHWFGFVDRLSFEGVAVESATLSRTSGGRMNVRATFSR